VAGERQFTVRVDPRVYKRLEELARREKRSISAQAAYLIEQALSRGTEQPPRSNLNKP
jgi:hypothetical protein